MSTRIPVERNSIVYLWITLPTMHSVCPVRRSTGGSTKRAQEYPWIMRDRWHLQKTWRGPGKITALWSTDSCLYATGQKPNVLGKKWLVGLKKTEPISVNGTNISFRWVLQLETCCQLHLHTTAGSTTSTSSLAINNQLDFHASLFPKVDNTVIKTFQIHHSFYL